MFFVSIENLCDENVPHPAVVRPGDAVQLELQGGRAGGGGAAHRSGLQVHCTTTLQSSFAHFKMCSILILSGTSSFSQLTVVARVKAAE